MTAPIETCQAYFDTLDDRFIASEAQGVTATYFYHLTGEGGGDWTVHVDDGALSVSEGTSNSPSVTYTMAAADYVRLANGELNGIKAVMTRKLKVKGNIMLAKKMNKFLPPRSA